MERVRTALTARHRATTLGVLWLASDLLSGCSRAGGLTFPALPTPALPVVSPLLGQPPPLTLFHLAIGLVTDGDSTHTEALAYYDGILITREPPASSDSFP